MFKNAVYFINRMLQITRDSFEKEIVGSKLPVIVDFWAEWCGPCRAMAPVFESVSKEFVGKMAFAKLDVDSNQELSSQFGVMSIPSLLVFKKGKEADRIVGSMSSDKLRAFVQKNL